MKRIPKYALTLVVLVSFVLLFFWKKDMPKDGEVLQMTEKSLVDQNTSATSTGDTKDVPVIVVDVKGEVELPGVYKLREENRVKDAIQKAGGMTDEADPLSVNLAQKLMDEMVIFVAPIQKGEGGEGNSHSFANKLSINRATLQELQSLSGIGEAKARKIVNYRDDHGPFQSLEDLLNISGIGKKTLEGFRDDIRVP